MADGTRLSPNTTTEDLAKRVGVGEGEKLRTSSRRESYLQKVSGLVTLRDTRVFVRGDGAHVKMNRETPEINITGTRWEQTVTDIPDDEYDLLVQETLLLHEDGHVLFSDWPSFERYMNRVDMNQRHLFKFIWNAAEDGAIERQMTNELNVRDDFRVMYANVHANKPGGFGIEQEPLIDDGQSDTYYKFPMAHAVITAILDMWQGELYDEPSGALRNLLDPANDDYVMGSDEDAELFRDFLPTIADYVEDMLTTKKARERNKRTWEFWEDFSDILDQSQVTGQKPMSQGNDADGDGQSMPDDAHSGIGEASRDADDLEDGGSVTIEVEAPEPNDDDDEPDGWGLGDDEDDGDDDDEDGDAGAGDDEDDGDDEQQGGDDGDDDGADSSGGDDEDDDSDEDTDADGDDEDGDDSDGDDADDSDRPAHGSGNGGLQEAEERVKRRYSQEIDREAEEVSGDSMLDEAEEFLEIIKKGNDAGDMPDRNMPLVIPQSDDYDSDRFRDAKNAARQLERLWKRKLKQQQKTQVKRGQRFGTPDGRSMHKTGRSTRLFKRRKTPKQKSYEAVIVLDRSSSMRGALMRQAERAAGALAMSLYGLGVEVSVISLDDNEAVLEVPFGEDPEEQKNVIFTGSSAGSTPLAQTTYLARHRINKHATKTRFMMIVTDGRPDDGGAFKKQVDACNFPVLGVEVGGNGRGNPGYDRRTKVPGNGNILSSLRNLVNEVMF